MAAKRQFELHLLRFSPHPLRDDFVTIGLLLQESDGGFAEFRITRDWRMLQCVAPEVELEWFEMLDKEVRRELGTLRRREDLLLMVNERFGTIIDVAPTKAILTEDPANEMEVLSAIYLEPLPRGEKIRQVAPRVAIVNAMRDAFSDASVLELMQRDIDLSKYTWVGDPQRLDFGYRVGGRLRMFHGVSSSGSVEMVWGLGLRFALVAKAMRAEQMQASLTAVVDGFPAEPDSKMWSGFEMLKANEVIVRRVGEVEEIAGEARLELRA
jgi:Protein of unknown function (DUF3037)